MPRLTAKIAAYIVAGLLALYACYFVYDLLTASTKTKARLGENTTEAAVESGSNAVNETGNQSADEAGIDKRVKDEKEKLDKASDAAAIDDELRGD